MRFFILASFTLFPFILSAQIVNIESQRIQSDTVGWFGSMGSNLLLEKYTTQVFSIDVNAHIQYKAKKSLYLFLADYNFLRGNTQTFSDNLFYHFRYNYKLNEWLRWEAFTQLQKNKVTDIDLRVLVGTGPRFKIHHSKKLALYAATSAMYEYEEDVTTPKVYKKVIRNSSYVTCTYKPVDNLVMTITTFYQPLFANPADYRVLNEVNINIAIIKNFSFVTTWSYLYDSRPVPGTPDVNYSLSSGVRYKF